MFLMFLNRYMYLYLGGRSSNPTFSSTISIKSFCSNISLYFLIHWQRFKSKKFVLMFAIDCSFLSNFIKKSRQFDLNKLSWFKHVSIFWRIYDAPSCMRDLMYSARYTFAKEILKLPSTLASWSIAPVHISNVLKYTSRGLPMDR